MVAAAVIAQSEIDKTIRFETAVRLAPSFRDKFDYSEDGHFGKLADLAFKAADALITKRDQEAKK